MTNRACLTSSHKFDSFSAVIFWSTFINDAYPAPTLAESVDCSPAVLLSNCRYDAEGHCNGSTSSRELRPIRLQWDIPTDCIDMIDSSVRVAQAIASDVDLHIQV